MLQYSTGGGLHWVCDVHNEDQGAMNAEGQARLGAPEKPWLCINGLMRVRCWLWNTRRLR